MHKPLFISFEGGEGAGKTTQIQMLKDYFEQAGQDIFITREPGGTPEAEKIRALLVQRDGGNWTPLAEAFLFFTARHMHVETAIKPALDNGKIVICDRFTDSTIAYQGYGHGFDLTVLHDVKRLSIGDFEPDITFLLDIPVEAGLRRAGKRMEGDDSDRTEDRFERLNIGFHEKLRQGFLTLANENSHRFCVLDAQQPVDTLHNQIIERINRF